MTTRRFGAALTGCPFLYASTPKTTMPNIPNDLAQISQRIKGQQPPAITPLEKQAAIAIATMEKVIVELIIEKAPIKTIFMSVFYFWVRLDAPLRGVKKKQIDGWSMPLPDAISSIIDAIKTTLAALPDHEPTPDMKKLGDRVNFLKSFITEETIDRPLPRHELLKTVPIVNEKIFTAIGKLLEQPCHPEVVSNVLLSNWMRISTLNNSVSEEYYQKMEYYFSEIKKAVAEHIPTLFQTN